jgi:hypothetical protein
VPVHGAIHELVASWCSNNQWKTLDPPGQVRFGHQSFLRALQASKLYDVQFGVVPAGEPAPVPGSTPVTVDVDYSRPNSKFSDAGFYFIIVEEVGPDTFTVYFRAGVPDHPAFDHCTNSPFGG